MFFGLALITIGALLLLIKMGILSGSFWGYFWPVILILLGLSFIFGPRRVRTWRHHWWPTDEGHKQ